MFNLRKCAFGTGNGEYYTNTKVLGIWWQKKSNYIEVSWAEGVFIELVITYQIIALIFLILILFSLGSFSRTNTANLEYIFLTTQYRALLMPVIAWRPIWAKVELPVE